MNSNTVATVISSSYFSYNKETKTFSVELSEISSQKPFSVFEKDRVRVGMNRPLRGFQLMCDKTGRVADFVLKSAEANAALETTHWILEPTQEAVQSNPGLSGTKIFVFND